MHKPRPDAVIGVGMDSCVLKTHHEGTFLVQTTDFFYPLVDDPYIQGKIACANVLSDLYAMGVEHCDNMLMLLALSLEMTPKMRKAITPLVIKGFTDLCEEAGSSINGGQTVLNPWMIVGGVATYVAKENEFILPELAEIGDVLVLTKPLGTQVAVNAHQWLGRPQFDKIKDIITEDEVKQTYRMAMHSMARLNRTGARLMQKYKAKGATDITGFGYLGHANNLAKNQRAEVDFEIHTLPVLPGMKAVDEIVSFKLVEGFSAETSGGLLVCLPKENVAAFCKEIEETDGVPAWEVGRVVAGKRTAHLVDNPTVLPVSTPELS
eukprot:m.72455 g.72455  ORF g.72455 m.72455 type:complete len:322 (+) comp20255_c1_seq3:477-1442(+)